MDQIQCPAGEHCLKKERGDICLMWHPPPRVNNIDTTEQPESYSNQVEEERLVQLALKKSREEQRQQFCQFCKIEVMSIDDLQFHQLTCVEREEKEAKPNTSVPEIVEVSTPVVGALALEDSMCRGSDSNTNISPETDMENEDENTSLSELISSYLTAADSLVVEIRKDLDVDQTLTGISGTTESADRCFENVEDKVGSIGDSIVAQDDNCASKEEYLNSFNISIDEERTGASYVELLQSYQNIFQKWQAAEIQSQLKEMKINDLESRASEMVERDPNENLCEGSAGENWNDILKELGDKKNTCELLKEKQEELSTYKKENKLLQEEVRKLKNEKQEVTHKLEEEMKERENQTSQVEEFRLSGEKLQKKHKEELRKKDMEINGLEEKMKVIEEKSNKKSQGEKIIWNKILSAEKLRIEHNKIIIMKDEKIKTLMENIVKIVEENKLLKVRLQDGNAGLNGPGPSSGDKEKFLKEVEKKEEELKGKERTIEQLRNDMKRNEAEILQSIQELQLAHENVEELVRKLKTKEKELDEKDEEIADLRKEIREKDRENRLLVENLSRTRDENVQLKNARRVVSDNDVDRIHTEIQDFKKDVMKQIKAINDLYQKKEKESKTPEKTMKCRQDHNTGGRLRNETRSKRKPNQNIYQDCSLIDTESDYEYAESDIDGSHNEEQIDGRWKLVGGSWQQLPVKPGTKTYSGAVRTNVTKKEMKKTLIISTSITRGISEERFGKCYEGEVKFKRMHGGKARWIKDDVSKHLPSGEWKNVVVQMGGNDLQDLYYPEAITRLANTIIETGQICRERGAETVFIAGVPVRCYEYTWERCRALNGELKKLCRRNNLTFIDNSNITHTDHLHHDGVHLNGDGDRLLANNYLDCLRKEFCTDS